MDNLENQFEETKKPFKINFLTVLLLLVIVVPVIYFLATSFNNNPEGTQGIVNTEIDALQLAKQTVISSPNYDTYVNLSLQYYNSGMYEECIAACNKALTYNANGDAAYNNIGASYGALENYKKEIEACEKAIQINPNNQLAKNNIQWAKDQMSKFVYDSLSKKNN